MSDYAAERLGVSGRTLEEDARVVVALRQLAQIERAFASGAIRWTQVRMLAGVATPQTERGWLRIALTSTTRQLAALVRGARAGDPAPSQGNDVAGETANARACDAGASPDACASSGSDPSAPGAGIAGDTEDPVVRCPSSRPARAASSGASSWIWPLACAEPTCRRREWPKRSLPKR